MPVEYQDGSYPQKWIIFDQQVFETTPIPEGHNLAGQLYLQINNLGNISGDYRSVPINKR